MLGAHAPIIVLHVGEAGPSSCGHRTRTSEGREMHLEKQFRPGPTQKHCRTYVNEASLSPKDCRVHLCLRGREPAIDGPCPCNVGRIVMQLTPRIHQHQVPVSIVRTIIRHLRHAGCSSGCFWIRRRLPDDFVVRDVVQSVAAVS